MTDTPSPEAAAPEIVAPEIVAQVRANLEAVHAHIAQAARDADRDPAAVALIAVSKMQPEERILAALLAGQRVYGENRVQEAEGRWPAYRERFPDVQLHLIGPLQTNKARVAVQLFDVIHTVDRQRLAQTLARLFDETGRRLPCYIEVNTGSEPQKAGVLPEDADAFIKACREDYRLPIVGLMCIPPADDVPAPHFAFLADIARRNGLEKLSMGMSADYEQAVALGATEVRVGSAIFGERLHR
ncbi:MAG: YggS family pyridoxal phosphate-dependent enzyme [Alphaproteobacteria bacterium]|nr:YggS family pyridoxal phosphate-dependent enzyme [Alphaproteobacteria bacterium]MCB9931658.1 YggS family pyridoxal phosphate-dependent enzyme [Alphaproteobacteria bacterium]